jgi:uncharacterized repeat protein (TIGR03803 family)
MNARRGFLFHCYVILLLAVAPCLAQTPTFVALANFDGTDGASPVENLVQATDGNLYGTTYSGGPTLQGTVFKLTRSGELITLYTFCAKPNCEDGASPFSSLIEGTDGSFYGTTVSGGAHGVGTVFKVTPQGSLTVVHSFDGTDGLSPSAGLIQAADGNFYGTTEYGGANRLGTVFKMTSAGVLTTLHSFDYTDGAEPQDALIQGTDGNFYGVTYIGGANGNYGTIFKITAAGVLTTLHSFDEDDGFGSLVSLVQADDGNFYGTAQGGAYDYGTVFAITPQGVFTTLHNFDRTDGSTPEGLSQATDGNFYGVTASGGANLYGTLFEMNYQGAVTTLHAFDHTEGSDPYGTPFQGTDGRFYGTAQFGGSENDGIIYSLSTGLGPFVSFLRNPAKVGQPFGILGQGLTGTSSVSFSGIPAIFTVVSDTFIKATVPAGATTGFVNVTTPTGVLSINVAFHVIR